MDYYRLSIILLAGSLASCHAFSACQVITTFLRTETYWDDNCQCEATRFIWDREEICGDSAHVNSGWAPGPLNHGAPQGGDLLPIPPHAAFDVHGLALKLTMPGSNGMHVDYILTDATLTMYHRHWLETTPPSYEPDLEQLEFEVHVGASIMFPTLTNYPPGTPIPATYTNQLPAPNSPERDVEWYSMIRWRDRNTNVQKFSEADGGFIPVHQGGPHLQVVGSALEDIFHGTGPCGCNSFPTPTRTRISIAISRQVGYTIQTIPGIDLEFIRWNGCNYSYSETLTHTWAYDPTLSVGGCAHIDWDQEVHRVYMQDFAWDYDGRSGISLLHPTVYENVIYLLPVFDLKMGCGG